MRYLNLKEKFDVTRVVVACLLLIVSVFVAVSNVDGWGYYLVAGVFLYPSQINIDFRE